MEQAAESSAKAYKSWRNTPVTARVRKIFEYRDRVQKNLVRQPISSRATYHLTLVCLPG
jgi:hypothetical protein